MGVCFDDLHERLNSICPVGIAALQSAEASLEAAGNHCYDCRVHCLRVAGGWRRCDYLAKDSHNGIIIAVCLQECVR